jgi:hypothetical protein
MSLTEFKDSSRSLWPFLCRVHRQEISVILAALALTLGAALCGCRTAPRDESPVATSSEETEPVTTVEPQDAGEEETVVAEEPQAEEAWDFRPGKEVSLFDGQTLGLWKVTDFGGQGDVYVKDGAIYMEMGSYTTGVTWTGPVVRMNYEIMLEAMRVDGTDFFCALTFPVGKDPCTLVLGGWGGTLCGLSNIGFYDASENETTTFQSFENKTWYHVRLRVLPDRIQAWVDGEHLIDVETTGKRIDIRPEMDLCQPLGIATWVTTGAVRNIFLTKLPETMD